MGPQFDYEIDPFHSSRRRVECPADLLPAHVRETGIRRGWIGATMKHAMEQVVSLLPQVRD
jgi:hypothetical protein